MSNPKDLSFVGHDPYPDDGVVDRGDRIEDGAETTPHEAPPVEVPAVPEVVIEAPPVETQAEAPPPAETEPEPEVVPEPPVEKKAIRIPKDRFDEVNERMQRAEAELKALRVQRETAVPVEGQEYDYDAAEQKYADAIVNGQLDEAKKLRGEIRERERAQAEQAATAKTMGVFEQVAVRAAIDAAVSLVNIEYPLFDPADSTYNQAYVDEALQLYNGLVQSGTLGPSEALVRAARATAALHGVNPVGRIEAPVAKPETGKPVSQMLEQKLKAAAQQPPQLSQAGVTNNAHGNDIVSMSEKDFDSLDETTLRKLRGDFL